MVLAVGGTGTVLFMSIGAVMVQGVGCCGGRINGIPEGFMEMEEQSVVLDSVGSVGLNIDSW